VDNGGAIFTDDGTITLTDCVLDSNDVTRLESSASENRGGAAIYAKDANVTLVNTNVTNNGRSDLDRSKGDMICAVIHLIDSDADITGGLFENNTCIYGGAINAESSTINTLIVSGATFNNNKGYNGGAINLHNIETTISDSNFTDNWVVGPGSSGYYGLGGAIAADGNGTFSVTGSNFTANRATGNGASAGAISVGLNEGYSATIDGCEFKENTAVNKAGAVFIGCYDATISNSVFSDDNVAEIGDAIYNGGNLELSGNTIDSTDSEIYSSGAGKVDTHV
jgi:predicted outer membrane repeat protein